MRVTVEVGEAGIGLDNDVTVGDATKATDVAVGDIGVGLVQLAILSTMNSNVRPGRMK